ncbi:MAG: site-specific integrase [Marinilabiliaceae bacterium]|nr:site-specific integrase [Marinilabiliaceae bacterium]
MKTNTSFGIQFIARAPKNPELPSTIYVRITVDGKRVELSLKQSINSSDWNVEKGMSKGRTSDAKKLNSYLEQIRGRINECYQELSLKKQLITAEAIKNLYLGIKEETLSLLGIFDYHNTVMKDTLEWGTLKNYFTTRRYIEEFLRDYLKTSDIDLQHLNYKFLADFERFVKSYVPKDSKLPCGQNTTMKHIERLRKVINMAVKNDWLEKDPFVKFKSSFIRTTREFLSAEELQAIEDKNFKIARLQQVRDLFLFSCYTGLAYIDVFELTPHNITRGIDGEYWIITQRHKTDIPVRVPLLPQPLAIIEKYKDHPQVLHSGKLLPGYSNQRLNSYLKEIADACEIDKPLTFHIARHTFATTVTLTNGVPIETVSKLLGHTSIKTTQIYAKVIEQKVSDDMLMLKTKLSDKKDKVLKISKY